jgi:PAS domain S-box-containing protein
LGIVILHLNQNKIVVEVPDLAISNKKKVIRVLHVDDDFSFLEISKPILSMENNFEIDNASSVDEALKKLEEQPYDAVVSDYEMPQKDGLEFLKELREKNNQIPFILLTGKGREDVAVKALNLGADRYLNKNGSPETVYCELVHAINKTVESRRSHKFLIESEQKYRELANCLPNIVFEADLKGRIEFANERAAQISGYLPAEIENGLNALQFVVPEEREKAVKNLQRLVSGGSYVPSEYTFMRKNGSTFPALITATPRFYNNQMTGFRGIVIDITEHKKAEEHRKVLERKVIDYSEHLKCMVDLRTAQLKDANERLVKSERLVAIGELAGMVGHDLRNPLTGIRNAAYFLKKKGAAIPEAQAKEMLETIDKCIDHSNKIINDLLEYSREMHLELIKYSACTLVDDATKMVQVPERIQIINHVQEDTVIWVDADKMMRVFINLVKNAIDAMPSGGTIEITSCQTTNYVEISFADTGPGIPQETLQKLFTPLVTTKAQGMGFGLAICKNIIEAHKGTITVKTEVNKGTTFTVALPIKPKVPPNQNDVISVE